MEDIVLNRNLPLDQIAIAFFDQLTLDTPILHYVISYTDPSGAQRRAHIVPSGPRVNVTLFRRKRTTDHGALELRNQQPLDTPLSFLLYLSCKTDVSSSCSESK